MCSVTSIVFLFVIVSQLVASNLIIFDHDGGVDDFHGLLQLIQHHNGGIHTIIGITTVKGNMDIDTVFNSTKSMLQLLWQQSILNTSIPIFKGCDSALLYAPTPKYKLPIHGPNGLGNFTFSNNEIVMDLETNHDIHASIAIIDLIKKYKELDVNNKIDIIAVGPLTNIALSIKLNLNIFKLINSLWIMGGTLYGKGNFNRLSEFNFANDPESAKIVLAQSHLFKIYIVPFDNMPWVKYEIFTETLDEIINKQKYNEFMSNMIFKFNEYWLHILKHNALFPGWMAPDFYATTAYLYHNHIEYDFMNIIYVNADIETDGSYSRGALAINWIEYMFPFINNTTDTDIGKIGIVESIDVDFILDKFKQLSKSPYTNCE